MTTPQKKQTPTQTIKNWIKDFVTKPNPVFGNLPPCPFAQKAIVENKVEASDLVIAASEADKQLIQDVRVFDEFIGKEFGNEKKSIALTVRLQPVEKTLTDAEIEDLSKKVIEKVENATGGVLRT